MKKFLLLGAAALMVLSAGAQMKRSSMNAPKAPQIQRAPISYVKQEAKVAPANYVFKAPKKADFIEPFYYRPAGAFYSPMIAVDGAGGYSYGQDFLQVKPYGIYQFQTDVYGADENTSYTWDVFFGQGADTQTDYVDGRELAVEYSLFTPFQNLPIFYAVDGPLDDTNAEWYKYQMTDYTMEGDADNPQVKSEAAVQAWACPNSTTITEEEGVDLLLSSKTLVGGGRDHDQRYTFTAYYGAEPYGNNEKGWWFGKNGEHIDGMAQIFEKPQNPYQLTKIYWMLDDGTICNGNVKLTCKVYKLDEIPAYNDTVGVRMGMEPGELIVTGEGYVTETTATDKNGFVEFTLYGFDPEDPELTYEYSPTIDYPIMVTIEGYNDPEAEDLVEFTSYIAADYANDEGYGEMAYLKSPINVVNLDENGDTIYEEDGVTPQVTFTGEYVWRGLNNFFRSGTMKTALGIFIVADQPFMTPAVTEGDYIYFPPEDYEYKFPDEGGRMVKTFNYSDGSSLVTESISLLSWFPSADGDWTLTCNGSDDLPEWLNIELEDRDEGWFGAIVNVTVDAEPLPEDVPYREAIIRFEIPGDYIDYLFYQGEYVEPVIPEDVNGDGEVTVADINVVIDAILKDEFKANCDVNGDGEITIADINRIINYILSH